MTFEGVNKFVVGELVRVSNGIVGEVEEIATGLSIETMLKYFRYKVRGMWYNEDELESYPYPIGSCEVSSNTVQVSPTRPCLCLGEEATFHRWVDDTRSFVKFNKTLAMETAKKAKEVYLKDGIIPDIADTIPFTATFALIELKDGTVKKVLPEEIRFVDKEN